MNVGEYIKALRTYKGLSQEELGQLVGVQRAAVQKWECGKVQNLKRETILTLSEIFNVNPSSFIMDENRDRDLKTGNKGVKIPVLGKVQAGVPIEAIEDILDYEEITESLAKTGEFFGLQIRGDSMEPLFTEGDVVIVRKVSDVDSGSLAVVLVNNSDATVKKINKEQNGIYLIANNPKYMPKFYSQEEVLNLPVEIIGKVIELRRKFK